MKLTKRRYLKGFIVVTLLLAAARWLFPAVAEPNAAEPTVAEQTEDEQEAEQAAVDEEATETDLRSAREDRRWWASRPHRIRSVQSYTTAFPDTNDLQLNAARRWGVEPVKNRADAEARKRELVYIGSSPYYAVDSLRLSIPYLVPRAAVLLSDIGQAFFDSLYIKGVPLHRLLVTSVLRSEQDVARLRQWNRNATENSCHLYGTTFDISYVRFETVEPPDGPMRRRVSNDTLKYVLAEVLRDMREQGRCYIKHEVKQPCFHMTVR